MPTLLSGPLSMKMTHMLRSLHDGILVGVGTIIADNPSLNTRLVQGEKPCALTKRPSRGVTIQLHLSHRHEPNADHPRLDAALSVVDQALHF